MNAWTIVAAAQAEPSLLMSMMPMILVLLVFYIIWFLPIQKKQKELNELLDNLAKGDKVITNGGFYGKVAKVEEDTVLLELADNVKVKVARRAIAGLASAPRDNGGK